MLHGFKNCFRIELKVFYDVLLRIDFFREGLSYTFLITFLNVPDLLFYLGVFCFLKEKKPIKVSSQAPAIKITTCSQRCGTRVGVGDYERKEIYWQF